jgi:O-antigen ligase
MYYIQHQAEILELISASKPMPLQGATRNLSHIYFSVYLAFCIPALWFEREACSRWPGLGLGLLSGALLALLFFIGARTGLVALLTGGTVWGIFRLRESGRWWLLPALGGAGLLAVLAAWYLLPSFQKRMQNSWEDLSAFQAGTTLPNTWSLTARLHAWKTATSAIRERPFTGYGIQNVHWRLWVGYHQTPVWQTLGRTPIYVHNQFLEWTMAFGILGLAIWVYVLLTAPQTTAAWVLSGVIAGGCLSESLLERQLGLGFWLLFLLLTQYTKTSSVVSVRRADIPASSLNTQSPAESG